MTYPRLATSAAFPTSPRSRALRLGTDYPRRLARKRPRVSTVASAQGRARRETKEEDRWRQGSGSDLDHSSFDEEGARGYRQSASVGVRGLQLGQNLDSIT